MSRIADVRTMKAIAAEVRMPIVPMLPQLQTDLRMCVRQKLRNGEKP
jgi:hypothetical protein